MKLIMTWEQYKGFANKAIKEKFPAIIDDDTVEFQTSNSDGCFYQIAETPKIVEFSLEDANEPRRTSGAFSRP